MEESLEELEARLYSQVYHDTSVEPTPEASDFMPLSLNRQSNKRYWQKSKNISTQNFDQQIFHESLPIEQQQPRPKTPFFLKAQNQTELPISQEIEAVTPTIKTFVPYTSVLSFMASPATPPPKDDVNKMSNYEKKKIKSLKFPKNGKVLNPMNKQGVTKGKSAMKQEIQAKKLKANMTRKKAQSKVVATIDLDDSDESDCIPIELPPPLLITVDSSDDEQIQKKRALSPSISSIISDDFIVAGDKRRLANPFKSEEIAGVYSRSSRVIVDKRETLEKVKALTKVPSSTSSSESARSSCERIVEKEKAAKAQQDQLKKSLIEGRQKRKSRSSLDNSNEDSIYGAKAKTSTITGKKNASDSSDDEQPCVSTKSQKMRRRKSTGSQKKPADCVATEAAENEPKVKQFASSTPLIPANKRSRYITPSYNDDEFSSMISEIISNGEPLEEDESCDDKTDSIELPAMKEPNRASDVVAQNDSSVIEVSDKTGDSVEEDCTIIEKPIEIVEVQDEDDDRVVSDSDDSMRGFKLPIECDISLNVTQVHFEPHEFIKAETSRELATSLSDDSVVNPEIGWNDEMKFYYDGSWGDKNFCISTILDEMPRDPKLWRVSSADRNRTPDSGCRVRCKKCNEVGHFAARCTKPRKPIVCFMCGEEGHRETRCPNSICLRCGKPNRLFSTICTSCSKLSKRYCPLCNYQGHDIEQCPDKWRRYHSTTTETGELISEYRVNDRVYCSICARRGHFAENCNQFLKLISGMITSSVVNIISHKPSFPRIYLNSVEQAKKTQQGQQQLLALITYFPYYRFNFQFDRRSQIYRRFLEQFKLHQERQQEMVIASNQAAALPAIEASKEKRSKKKLKRIARRAAENQLQVSINSNGNRTVSATCNEVSTTSEFHDDSNSNYSFSEFYKQTHTQPVESKVVFKSPDTVEESLQDKSVETTQQTVVQSPPEGSLAEQPKFVKNPFAVALPEFISLGNDESFANQAPVELSVHTQIVREPEKSCEAKILLTKENFMLLKTGTGQNFLYDLQSRLDVITEFQWDSTGSFLTVTGLPSNQSMFHLEVREYLYRTAIVRHEKQIESTSQLPKAKASIICFIKTNLGSVNKLKLFAVKQILEAMYHAQQKMDHKKALKCRKNLNIAFIGNAELVNGGEHIGALRRIVRSLEKEMAQGKVEISQQLRDEIKQHMRPIFSTMDHGDYRNLFNQYSKIMKQRRKQNLLQNPI